MRVFKMFRFAWETKYWLDRLIALREEELQKSIRGGRQEKIEKKLLDPDSPDLFSEMDGVSVNVTLNVTAGSVIEQAVRHARGLKPEDWEELSVEMESAKKKIEDNVSGKDATPRVCMNLEIYRELEEIRRMLKEKGSGLRVPRMTYIIKLVVFNLFRSKIK